MTAESSGQQQDAAVPAGEIYARRQRGDKQI